VITHTTIHKPTGRITRLGRSPILPASNDEFLCIEGEYPADQYYSDNGEIKPRAPIPVALDREVMALGETAALTGLPVPCKVQVDAVVVDVTDGILTITPSTVGQYVIHINEVQYQPVTLVVTVND